LKNFLEGEEMSYFIISDGKTIKSFETAQDHKRVLEGDKGKNTGGMGAYSPSRL
jgi:phosphoribosylamine--glycine ligase